MLARLLGPIDYGNFIFLIGSFIALREILELGTSEAFYTFLSQKPRGWRFIGAYGLWQLVQFGLPLLVIGLLLPDDIIHKIWLGHGREIVLISFAAVFLREQAWNTIVQIGESLRLTHRVQISNLIIAAVHLLLITVVWLWNTLSLELLFILIALEYLIAITIGIRVVGIRNLSGDPLDKKAVYEEYRTYCAPLILYSLVGFAYVFTDRWLLQNFGGAAEQGYYGIGYQFAIVSLLATTSLLNIFWKEIAEAKENQDQERIQSLYKKVCRFLFMTGAVLSGFLIPWSEEIIRLCLGSSYLAGSSTLAIMLFYPIHQSLGQITGTLLMASSRTKTVAALQSAVLVVSIPISYLVLAPPDAWVPGLGLGSQGLALKMVVLQIIGVNFIAWWIARDYGWKFDWTYQVFGLGGALFFGFLAFEITAVISQAMAMNLFWKSVVDFLIYSIFISFWLWNFPELTGMSRTELKTRLSRLSQLAGK